MTTTRFILAACTAMIAALCLCTPAQSQQIGVRLDAPQRMYVGDTADMQIVVTGSRNPEAPDLSGLKDFEVIRRGAQDRSSTMTMIINGRVSTQSSIEIGLVYSITPRRAGQLTIPPLSVLIDGRTYTTQGATVEAVEPAQAADFKIEVQADRSEAFVGQPVHVSLVWTIGKDIRAVDFAMPIEGCDAEVLPGPRTVRVQNGPNAAQVRLNGQQMLAPTGSNTITIDRVIIPKSAGVITIGPSRADFLAVVGQRQPRFMDFPFDDRAITERQFSSAPALTLRVNELPTDGRPANFSGLVGNYVLSASADASDVSVGDPINLMVSVSGPYPLTLVPPLDLRRQSGLKGAFRIPREPILPEIGAGNASAVFRTMIRPRTPDAAEIGPISLSYFDPDAKRYKLAQSNPIPLKVRAANLITLPDEPEEQSAPTPTPIRRPGGMPDIVRGPLTGGPRSLDLDEELRSPRTLALLLAPPGVCAGAFTLMGFARWRRRDPAAHRRRAALARLRRGLKRRSPSGDPADAIAGAVSNFAADWFDQARDTLTAPQAAAMLRADGSPAGTRLGEILASCDRARFGTRAAPDPVRPGAETIPGVLAEARAFAAEGHGRVSA